MSNLIVAIDGPAASGKSSVARRVAAVLNCVYVDSGSLYRGLTWQAYRDGLDCGDAKAISSLAEKIKLDFFMDAGAVRFKINGADPRQELRSESVQENVSRVAAMPPVRAWTLRLLRDMTRFGCLVMEGRDIGTVVFPDASYKFYLDADPAERARRRYNETMEAAGKVEFSSVSKSLSQRDARDSGRNVAPLRKADDAHVIDTTKLSIDEVVARIVDLVRHG